MALPGALPGQKGLVWDSCSVHKSKAVKAHCAERSINTRVVPGGLTSLVQAGDVSHFKPFKDKLFKIIEQWKVSGEVNCTAAGNPKAPSKSTVCNWVREAWDSLSQEAVMKGLVKAGYSDASDYEKWYVSNHDKYGEMFRNAWKTKENVQELETLLGNEAESDDPLAISI